MLKRLPIRALLPVVAMVAGSVAVVAAPAAGASAVVPSSHVKECADAGLENAAAMTQVSSASGTDASGGLTSRASAWVYAVAGSDQRCVVVKAVGARVQRRTGRATDYSVGHLSASDGSLVVDTGEVLPFEDALSGFGGATERTRVTASVDDVVQTDRFDEDDADYLPPSLAALIGHEVTARLRAVSIDVVAQAWTTRHLAGPLPRARGEELLRAEVKVIRARHAARMAELAAKRDEQLALAATEAGLVAAWRTYAAKELYGAARMFATAALRESVALARQHAADARRGTLTREAYLHEITLTVPLG